VNYKLKMLSFTDPLLENFLENENMFFNHKTLIFIALLILILFMVFVYFEHTYNKNKGTTSFKKALKFF